MRFLTLRGLFARKGGRESVVSVLAYLNEADHDAYLEQAIDWAESRVLSLLTPRYGQTLPRAPETASEEIKGLVADLARMQLELAHTDQAAPNVIELGSRALAQLRDVARGVASLDLPELPADDLTPSLGVVRDEDRPSMSRALARRLPR